MTETLFNDVQTETKIVEAEDGSIKIGETFYKSKEEAFKGKAEADKHIAITQAENKELRDQVKTLQDSQGTALQKLLEKVDEQTKTQSRSQGDEDYSYREPTTDTVQSDPEEIKRLVQEQVKSNLDVYDQARSTQELANKKEENLLKIREALIKKCGSKEGAKAAWEAYVSDPSFDNEIYELEVVKQPDKLVEAINPVTPVSFGNTNIPTSQYVGSSSTYAGPKPRSYYAKIMKESPRQYREPDLQRQMKADAEKLGMERFLNS